VLLAAGVACLLAAIGLISTAAGRPVTPLAHLPLPHTHEGRAVVALVVVAVLVALLALVLRPRPRVLGLPVADGVVIVPAETLISLVRDELAQDPEVLRVDAALEHSAEGTLRADVRVIVRPLADTAALARELGARLRQTLERAGGWPVDVRRFDVRAVTVAELPRYLS
jgi:hypothetical protein